MDQILAKTYTDLANSERQVIWARNAAMMVANSLILNVVATGRLQPAWFFCFVGAFICVLWLIMTVYGWRLLHRHNSRLAMLTIGGETPFNYLNQGTGRDVIRACTIGVIVAVGGMYLIAAYQIKDVIGP